MMMMMMMMMHVDCVVQGVRYIFSEDGELMVSISHILMTSDRLEAKFLCSSTAEYTPERSGVTKPRWTHKFSEIGPMQAMTQYTPTRVLMIKAGYRPRASVIVTIDREQMSMKTLLRELQHKLSCDTITDILTFNGSNVCQ